MSFYTSKPWLSLRPEILERDLWCCRICGCLLTTGRAAKDAAVVDHVIPRLLAPELALEPDNLWAICKADHDSVCASIERKHTTPEAIKKAKLAYRPIGIDGYPVKTPHRAI